jgi:hypothetical protein
MIGDYDSLAEDFLAGLTPEEKTRLYNDLLALEDVHKLNQYSTYYTFKNLKRVARRHSERRKRTIRYMNNHNNELIIHQIHVQHFFKNNYCLQVYFNTTECSYVLVEALLSMLKAPTAKPLHTLRGITI